MPDPKRPRRDERLHFLDQTGTSNMEIVLTVAAALGYETQEPDAEPVSLCLAINGHSFEFDQRTCLGLLACLRAATEGKGWP